MSIIEDKKIGFIVKGLLITLLIPLIIGAILFFILYLYNIPYDFRDIMLYITGSVAILTFIMHNINGDKNSKLNKEKNEELKRFNEERLELLKEKNSFDKKTNEDIKKFHESKIDLLKQKNSYAIVSVFARQEMVKSLSVYRKIREKTPSLIIKSNVEPLKQYLKDNPDDHTHLNLLLNCFENTALQIKRGYVDEEILKDALHSVSWNVYCTLSSYIKDIQSDPVKEKCWDEFVKICKKWGQP